MLSALPLCNRGTGATADLRLHAAVRPAASQRGHAEMAGARQRRQPSSTRPRGNRGCGVRLPGLDCLLLPPRTPSEARQTPWYLPGGIGWL